METKAPKPIPRDIAPFGRLSPDSPATISPRPETALACLSTLDLIARERPQA